MLVSSWGGNPPGRGILLNSFHLASRIPQRAARGSKQKWCRRGIPFKITRHRRVLYSDTSPHTSSMFECRNHTKVFHINMGSHGEMAKYGQQNGAETSCRFAQNINGRTWRRADVAQLAPRKTKFTEPTSPKTKSDEVTSQRRKDYLRTKPRTAPSSHQHQTVGAHSSFSDCELEGEKNNEAWWAVCGNTKPDPSLRENLPTR